MWTSQVCFSNTRSVAHFGFCFLVFLHRQLLSLFCIGFFGLILCLPGIIGCIGIVCQNFFLFGRAFEFGFVGLNSVMGLLPFGYLFFFFFLIVESDLNLSTFFL